MKVCIGFYKGIVTEVSECDCNVVNGTSFESSNQVRDLDLAQVETEEQCSLVTVLASDGYTCITSPVISNR